MMVNIVLVIVSDESHTARPFSQWLSPKVLTGRLFADVIVMMALHDYLFSNEVQVGITRSEMIRVVFDQVGILLSR